MQYRMEEKPAFRVIGYAEEISMINGENFARIPKIWDEFPRERCLALEGAADGQYPGCFGLVDICAENPEKLTYMVAVSSKETKLAPWMREWDLPAARYAVFETPLAELQDTTRRVFGEWLPASGFEHGPSPELEYYPNGDMSDAKAYICELWVPVVEK